MDNTVLEIIRNNGITPGCIAISTAGHDVGRVYIVLKVNNKVSTVADGTKRSFINPKIKRVSHIKVLGLIESPSDCIKQIYELKKEEEQNQKIRKLIEEFLNLTDY